jgi:N-acetylmuramoyl-L-alanine amidase
MFECLKKLIQKPAPVDEGPSRVVNVTDGKVGLIVGHNEEAQGALNYLHETEWAFNSRIMRKVQQKLSKKNYSSFVIFRPTGVRYSSQVKAVVAKCKELGITHTILAHFNSAGQSARGCEFLVPSNGSMTCRKMADMATDLLNERLGIKERRDDGVYVVNKHHRGSGMLFALSEAGIHVTMAEPCFAGYRTEESAAIFENEDAYVDILKEVAESCCNGTIKKYNLG